MYTPSADARGVESVQTRAASTVRVWDAPVRVLHWLLAFSFLGAWLTSEGDGWRYVHVTFGYTMAGLVAFRLLWGLVGSRHARFADFVRAPSQVKDYLRSLARGRPAHHVGHNPAGGWAIVVMLCLIAATASLGWATYHEVGGKETAEWLGDVHGFAGDALFAVVLVHLAGVAVSSWLHRENLVRAMITGRKAGAPADDIGRPWRAVAAVVLAGALGFWTVRWVQAPPLPAPETHAGHHHGGTLHDHDDDND